MVWLLSLIAGCVASAAPMRQPVPFSHKQHAGDLKQECKLCHINPDPGKFEGIAGVADCLQCHSNPKTDTPAMRQLAAYAKKRKEIPWVRVYVVPQFVIFDHRKHTDARTTCEDCHGDVAQSDELTVRPDFTQQHCTDCHRSRQVSTECRFCHNIG